MQAELDSVEKHARDLTPAAYMQVVGIVQAFALSFLLLERGGQRDDHYSLELFFSNPTAPDALLFLLQFLAVFQLIVLTWYANAQHVMAFRLRAGVGDALIPFSFALPEFFLVRYCDPATFPQWCSALVALTIVGVVAYVHMFSGLYWRAIRKRENEDDRTARVRVGAGYPLFAIAVIGIAGALAALQGYWPLLGVDAPVQLTRLATAGWLNVIILAFAIGVVAIAFWSRAKAPVPTGRRNLDVRLVFAMVYFLGLGFLALLVYSLVHGYF